MKRTALCTALLAVLLSFTACTGGSAPQIINISRASSAESQASKPAAPTESSSPEVTSPESDPSEISLPESSLPEISEEPGSLPEPSQEAEPEQYKNSDELYMLLTSLGIDSSYAEITEGIEHDYKGVLYTKAELVLTRDTDEAANLLEELSSYEKSGLFLTNMTLSRNSDIFTVSLRLEVPYTDPSGSSDSAAAYIKQHWGGLDRAALLRAFIDDNMDYSLSSASGLLFSDRNGIVKLQTGVDFRSYDGFVTYKYKLSNSPNFSVEGDISVNKTKDEDTEYPLHSDTVLYTDKFRIIQET